jgi:phosphatidylglycerol---prolipoprotein diacylglyceryl transferase
MSEKLSQKKNHFMTYPLTFSIGENQVHLHWLFEIFAYTLGYRLYVFLRKKVKDPIDDSGRLWIFIAAAGGGFLGSHFLAILEKPSVLQANSSDFLHFYIFFMSNKTVLGGLLGGLIAVEWTKKRLGITTSSGDLMAFPMMMALAIGRIGCHCEGLDEGTFGIASTLPFAMDFGDHILRHPVYLYEIFFLIVLFSMIYTLEKKYTFWNGGRFQFFMVAYLTFRFCVEYVKNASYIIYGLSSIQIACLLGLLYYCILFFRLKKQIHYVK